MKGYLAKRKPHGCCPSEAFRRDAYSRKQRVPSMLLVARRQGVIPRPNRVLGADLAIAALDDELPTTLVGQGRLGRIDRILLGVVDATAFSIEPLVNPLSIGSPEDNAILLLAHNGRILSSVPYWTDEFDYRMPIFAGASVTKPSAHEPQGRPSALPQLGRCGCSLERTAFSLPRTNRHCGRLLPAV